MNGSSSFPQSNNEAASVDIQRTQPPSGAQLASTSTTTSAPMDMVPGGSMLMFGQNDAILDQLVQQAIAHQNSQHHQTPLSSFFSPAASESPTYYSTSSRRPSASPAGQANLSPLLSTPLDIAPQQPYATSTPLSTSLSPLLAGSLFPNSVRATPLNGSGFVGGPGSPMNTPSSANSSFGYAGISLFPFSSSYTSPIAASPPSANPFAHFGGDLSSFNPYTLGGGNATHGQGHAGPLSSSYYYSPKPELSPTTATLGLSTPIVDAQIAPTYGPTSLPTTELDPSQIQSHLATTHTQSLEERIAQLSDPTQQEEVRAKLAEWTDASSSAEQSTSVPTVVDSNDALAPFPSLFPNRQDEPQQHQHHDQDFTDASLQDEARSHEDHIRRQQFESNDFVYQSIVTPIPLGEGESDDSYFHSAPAFYQSGRFGTAHQGGSVLQLEMMQSLPRPHPPVYQSYQPQQQQSQAQAHPQMQSQVQHAPYMTYDYRFEGSLQYPVNATTAAAAANSLVQPISTPMIIPPSLPLTTVTSSPSLTRRRLRASTQTRASSVASSSVGMSSEKRTPPKHVLQYISRNALR
ncbi:hypothetical protein FS842_008493, partial [Serendipita sp. 407]